MRARKLRSCNTFVLWLLRADCVDRGPRVLRHARCLLTYAHRPRARALVGKSRTLACLPSVPSVLAWSNPSRPTTFLAELSSHSLPLAYAKAQGCLYSLCVLGTQSGKGKIKVKRMVAGHPLPHIPFSLCAIGLLEVC